jgi:hypothetical protein
MSKSEALNKRQTPHADKTGKQEADMHQQRNFV